MFFHPLVLFMMMALVVGVIVLFFVVQLGVISYAFDKIGVLSEAMFSRLATPVVSIGGAGTFEGVFLTGIIAVLLA